MYLSDIFEKIESITSTLYKESTFIVKDTIVTTSFKAWVQFDAYIIIEENDDIDLTTDMSKVYSTIVIPPGNTNGDKIVNVQDLGDLLGEFDYAPVIHPYADINGH